MGCHVCAEATWDGAPDRGPAMRDTGRSTTVTAVTGLLACLHQPPGSPPGRAAATVVPPGLLAPDVPSGQGLQPVKGSGPG